MLGTLFCLLNKDTAPKRTAEVCDFDLIQASVQFSLFSVGSEQGEKKHSSI